MNLWMINCDICFVEQKSLDEIPNNFYHSLLSEYEWQYMPSEIWGSHYH